MKAVYEQIISDLTLAVSKLELHTDNDTDADRHTKRRIARVLKKALVKLQAMSTHDLLVDLTKNPQIHNRAGSGKARRF
jgi:hypothetical protein